MNNIIFPAVIILLILYILSEKVKSIDTDKTSKYPYKKKKYIFTQNEFNFYRKLKPIADKYECEIFSKIRIADIVSVTEKGKEYTKYFNKIKSKHIDFVMLDNKTMQVRLLIELDDSSHDTEKRKERDIFVNTLFEKTEIPLLRIRNCTDEILEQEISNMIL